MREGTFEKVLPSRSPTKLLASASRVPRGAGEFTKRMAVAGGISVSQAAEIESAICAILRDAVAAGEMVSLRGFGVMRATTLSGVAWDPQKKKRTGRSTRVVRFKGKEISNSEF